MSVVRHGRGRRGVTLVELVIALAILGLLAGLAGLALRPAPPVAAADTVAARVAAARATAVREGRPVTVEVLVRGEPAVATALPDGRVVADALVESLTAVDPLTGRSARALR